MLLLQVMMKNCWNKDPAIRPTFVELDRRIKAMDVSGMQSRAIQNGVRWDLFRHKELYHILRILACVLYYMVFYFQSKYHCVYVRNLLYYTVNVTQCCESI